MRPCGGFELQQQNPNISVNLCDDGMRIGKQTHINTNQITRYKKRCRLKLAKIWGKAAQSIRCNGAASVYDLKVNESLNGLIRILQWITVSTFCKHADTQHTKKKKTILNEEICTYTPSNVYYFLWDKPAYDRNTSLPRRNEWPHTETQKEQESEKANKKRSTMTQRGGNVAWHVAFKGHINFSQHKIYVRDSNKTGFANLWHTQKNNQSTSKLFWTNREKIGGI